MTISEYVDYNRTDHGSFFVHSIPLLSSAPDTTQTASIYVCYVIETKVLPGKFDVVKAKALGVPKGPMFGSLQRGMTVTLMDGRIISPTDVLGPSEPARYAAVICNLMANACDVNGMMEQLVGHPIWGR